MSASEFRPQFTLKQMLLAVTLLSIPLSLIGWWLHVRREQQAAIEAARAQVAELGGSFWMGNVNGDYNIELQDRNVNKRQLETLARHLRRFPGPYLDQTHYVILDLSGNPISDESLTHLIGVRLTELNVRNTPLTDNAIPVLEQLGVPYLRISDTQITDSGVQRLRQSLDDRGILSQVDR